MGRTATLLLFAVALALTFAGCGGCDKKEAPKKEPPPIDRPVAQAEPFAVLTGSVRLASPEVPAFTDAEMERQVLDHAKRGAWPDECSPPKILDRRPLQLTDEGKLTGVVIAVSNFKKHPPKRKPVVHEATIRDCRLTPSTILAMQGDTLKVTSEVKFPFMPGYGPPSPVKTLMPGQSYDVELKTLGASPVSCGFTAPCGRTDVIVLSHTLAALTDAEGNFRIDSFPPGEQVTVTAWHPLLQQSEQQIEIAPGETKSIELVVSPVQR
jgi:hypothetical protein